MIIMVMVRKQYGGKGDATYYVRIPRHIYEALGAPEAFRNARGWKIFLLYS